MRTALDALAIPLGQREVPPLMPGTAHTATLQVIVPSAVGEAGIHYVLAVADGDAATSERDETNHVRAARVASSPDVIIDAVTAPASAAGGAPLALRDTVRNRGVGPSVATRLRFYLSTRKSDDPFLAIPIGSRTFPGLAVGARCEPRHDPCGRRTGIV